MEREIYTDATGKIHADNLADRNVEQLNFTGKALGKAGYGVMPRAASLPGSRPDGGMARPDGRLEPTSKGVRELLDEVQKVEETLRANLVDARNIIDNFERDMIKAESKIAELEAQLDEERQQRLRFEGHCTELQDILRKAAAIMVNGSKERPT